MLSTLSVTWMNHPQQEADHAYKPRQLALAVSCGLTVPRTLVTNDADAVRRFDASNRHGTIVKVFGANVLFEDGHRKVAHTRWLNTADLDDLAGVELTAHRART
ncbi:hypothetical protein [Actinokineospora sp.]|uniref:hypothetical protein n=1 Tax=Actinokineospora sp. TaxID=1872133 RepID=UPI004037C9C3